MSALREDRELPALLPQALAPGAVPARAARVGELVQGTEAEPAKARGTGELSPSQDGVAPSQPVVFSRPPLRKEKVVFVLLGKFTTPLSTETCRSEHR